MAQGVNPIQPTGLNGPQEAQRAAGSSAPGFRGMLSQHLSEVNELQLDAEKAINELASGQRPNVTEVMAAVEKADLAFRNLMAVRNKIIDAYKEISQLRI